MSKYIVETPHYVSEVLERILTFTHHTPYNKVTLFELTTTELGDYERNILTLDKVIKFVEEVTEETREVYLNKGWEFDWESVWDYLKYKSPYCENIEVTEEIHPDDKKYFDELCDISKDYFDNNPDLTIEDKQTYLKQYDYQFRLRYNIELDLSVHKDID